MSRSDSLHAVLEDYMDLVAVRGIARSRLGLLGLRYGGYMATLLTMAKPVCFLALRSPAPYPDADRNQPEEELDRSTLRAYRTQLLAPDQNRLLWCCKHFRGDVLRTDAQQDEVIRPEGSTSDERAFRRVRSMTRHTLAGADHQLSSPVAQSECRMVLVEWFGRQRR